MLERAKYFSKEKNNSKPFPLLLVLVLVIFFSTFPRFSFAQYTDIINSNIPGNSMGAYTVGEAVYQLETFYSNDHQKHIYLNTDNQIKTIESTFRFGFKERIELIYEFGHRTKIDNNTNASFKGLSKNRLGFKVLLYDPHQFAEPDYYSWKNNHRFVIKNLIPVVSLYAGLNVHKKESFFNRHNPFDPTSEVYPTIYDRELLILQQHLSPYWVLVTNIAIDKPTSEREYSLTSTLIHGFKHYYKLSLFAEFQSILNDYYSDEIFRAGGAYLINTNIQVDAFLGSNIKNTPSRLFFGLGASIRVDNHFK